MNISITARFLTGNCNESSMVPTGTRMIYNRAMKRRVIATLICICGLTAPMLASAELRITEIMYDPEGSDSKKEWVEIFNEGPYLVDLSTVKFADKSAHILNAPPKNGGTGTMSIVPGAYVILAADATTFHSLYPNISQVIDTAMSLGNSGATIGLGTSKGPLASASYDASLGGNGNGESLQWKDGVWLHAAPTPGNVNAKASTVPVPVITEKPIVQKSASAQTVSSKTKTASAQVVDEKNDPIAVVNATPTDADISEVAAAGSTAVSPWWLAASVLAISTGAAVTMIARRKKEEWTIEES